MQQNLPSIVPYAEEPSINSAFFLIDGKFHVIRNDARSREIFQRQYCRLPLPETARIEELFRRYLIFAGVVSEGSLDSDSISDDQKISSRLMSAFPKFSPIQHLS